MRIILNLFNGEILFTNNKVIEKLESSLSFPLICDIREVTEEIMSVITEHTLWYDMLREVFENSAYKQVDVSDTIEQTVRDFITWRLRFNDCSTTFLIAVDEDKINDRIQYYANLIKMRQCISDMIIDWNVIVTKSDLPLEPIDFVTMPSEYDYLLKMANYDSARTPKEPAKMSNKEFYEWIQTLAKKNNTSPSLD